MNIDFIQKFEDGTASEEDIVREFQVMINNGSVWNLQGTYARYAADLVHGGHCTLPTNTPQMIVVMFGFGADCFATKVA